MFGIKVTLKKKNNMSSIHKFKQGDIITRVEPSKAGDRSYMGNKLIFISYFYLSNQSLNLLILFS
jgi:hypothetical protein